MMHHHLGLATKKVNQNILSGQKFIENVSFLCGLDLEYSSDLWTKHPGSWIYTVKLSLVAKWINSSEHVQKHMKYVPKLGTCHLDREDSNPQWIFHIVFIQSWMVWRKYLSSTYLSLTMSLMAAMKMWYVPKNNHNPIVGGSCHKYNFCRDKTFVVTNIYFVATKVYLSRQTHVYSFVSASILLLLKKTCFVATKMILLAAPANDTTQQIKRIHTLWTFFYFSNTLHQKYNSS